MRSRKNRVATAGELREQAAAVMEAADEKARLELERGEGEAEALWQRADDAEFAECVEERKAQDVEKAARAARCGIEARAAGDAEAERAVGLAAEVAEARSEVARREGEQRSLSERVARLTAVGRIADAVALEKGLEEVDSEPVRGKLAGLVGAEGEARDRAAELYAQAEQHQAEAAERRAALERVEAELAPEFEKRRERRALHRFLRLRNFDERHRNGRIAARALLEQLDGAKSKPDSANRVLPDEMTVEIDGDRRLVGVAGPIRKS